MNQPVEQKEPFVQIGAVAEHFDVSVSTIRAWIRQGLIPKSTFIKLGNTYRFRVSSIEAALLASDVGQEPDDEPEQVELFDEDDEAFTNLVDDI